MSVTTWLTPRCATALGVVRMMQEIPPETALTGPAIASALDLARRYAESSLQDLVKAGILRSVRGPSGGYTLSGAGVQVTVGSVIRAVGRVSDGATSALQHVSDTLFQHLENIPVSSLPAFTRSKKDTKCRS